MKRERLGSRASFAQREYIYQGKDGYELDEIQGYDVSRRRVLFDDILLVTLHRFIPWVTIVAAFLLFLLFGGLSLGVGASLGLRWGILIFVLTAGIALGYMVLLLAIRGSAVTIHGRRTRIRVDFGLRSGRAREVYIAACRMARFAQREGVKTPRPGTAATPP